MLRKKIINVEVKDNKCWRKMSLENLTVHDVNNQKMSIFYLNCWNFSLIYF